MPPPRVEVSVSTGRFISESIVTLFCNINLPSTVNSQERVVTTWFGPSGVLQNSSSTTVSNIYAIASGVFQSNATIANYVPSVNNGEYTCNATVIPSSSYVIGNSGTDRRRVMISGQYNLPLTSQMPDSPLIISVFCSCVALGLIVQVQPSMVSVLDVAPYNTFSIVCTASVPTNVTAIKRFEWRSGSSGSGTNLMSGAGTTITNLNVNNATSTSVLTTNANTSGSFLYTCDVSVLTSQSSATATIAVNGIHN